MDDHHLFMHGLPRILFAHRFETRHYHARFDPRPDFLEITHVEAGESVIKQGGQTLTLPPDSLIVTPYLLPREFSCPGGLHRHLTVGIHVPLSQQERPGSLPLHLPPYRREGHREAVELLRRIVALHGRKPRPNVHSAALCLALLGELESCARQGVCPPALRLYCDRAVEYMTARLDQTLRVPDIAAHLGISPGYLSLIFKQQTGETLITCLQRLRVARARELMAAKDLSLEDAGAQAGVPDPGYLRRLMRRYPASNANR